VRRVWGPGYAPIYNDGPAGAGGSGVVILRYSDSLPAAASVTGGTLSTDGGYRRYTFNGSGSITF
jgi:hypothetical protein